MAHINGSWVEVPPTTATPSNPLGSTPTYYNGTVTTTATCKHDPYSNASGAHAHCGGRQWSPVATGAYGITPFEYGILTFNGHALPYFFTDRAVNDQKAAALDTAADEQKVIAPEVVSPMAGKRYYSQDVLMRALIPIAYKNDQQTCCTVELQKLGDDGVSWQPKLTVSSKTNVDTMGMSVPFSLFEQWGFGSYRVRMAPNKLHPMDAQPWSPYTTFGVEPREILEVPKIIQPQENASYSNVLPIDITIPSVAKKAGVQCCEVAFQVKRGGVWTDSKTITDSRLTDNPVNYDPYTIDASGGAMRLRVRFHKSANGEALNWSNWREYTTPDRSLRSVTLPPHAGANLGAAAATPKR
jgi:hypothetical protein